MLKKENPKKGKHGHRPSSDYQEAKVIDVAHQFLKKGDLCPECLKGRLFNLKPGTVLRIVGQPWLQVEIYRPERLRCSLCGRVHTASLPEEVATGPRTNCTAKAIVTLLKYRAGVPFYRQEKMQEFLGTPISASEIWEMTEAVANDLQPVYSTMCMEAANGDLIHNDDTSMRVLSAQEEDNDKKTTVTSVILSVFKESQHKIALYFTGEKLAGENLNELLHRRSEELAAPIQQCDALSHNMCKDHETQLSCCLAHLRRKFYELVDNYPKVVIKVIGWFTKIFDNDRLAPQDENERLQWHQKQSSPVMEELKAYGEALINDKEVEPNSNLGKALAYMKNHWEAFTLFLKVPGVPLTNNDAERLIKTTVLNRKNAYFYRNETGAKIGDILTSVIETCILNGVNPWNYLIDIQKNREAVRQNPLSWAPWNYEKTIKGNAHSQESTSPDVSFQGPP